VKFTIDLKVLIQVVVIVASAVAMYFSLKAEIKEAARLPQAQITRIEYDMKFKNSADEIIRLIDKIEKLEAELDSHEH
jgi:hypothetical protein